MNKVKTAARISEIDGLSDTVLRLYNADESAQADSFLQTAMAELKSLSAQITTAILQDKSLSNLDEADSARDEAIRNLGTLITGYTAFPVQEKKNAAVFLKAIFDKYSKAGILSANYTSESSMIESMLEDYVADEAVANIEKLDGVSVLISAVRTAQDSFTAANDAYVKSVNSKGKSASSFKKPLLAAVNDKLVPYLNTMALVGSTALSDFSKGVEAEINRLNETIAKRTKKTSVSS